MIRACVLRWRIHSQKRDKTMRYEETTLKAIRFRARATGDAFMSIDDVANDLGGPVDFEDVLARLDARRMIILHRDSGCLRLTERGLVA